MHLNSGADTWRKRKQQHKFVVRKFSLEYTLGLKNVQYILNWMLSNPGEYLSAKLHMFELEVVVNVLYTCKNIFDVWMESDMWFKCVCLYYL